MIQHLNWNRFKNRERDPGKCWDLLEDEEMKKMKTARLIVTFTDLQLRNHLHSELPYPFIKTFNF